MMLPFEVGNNYRERPFFVDLQVGLWGESRVTAAVRHWIMYDSYTALSAVPTDYISGCSR
jgi:hypothetical protein